MESLEKKTCEACTIDAPKVTDAEKNDFLDQITDWSIINHECEQLQKVFDFKDYAAAIEFTIKIAQMADREDHHPQIILEWGKVTVLWWSHKIQGLHKNDFICAAKTDQLYST